MNIETQAIHAGHHIDPATGAVTPPIHLSTTFERQADGSYPHGYDYTRSGNPNREALEENLTALEGGFETMTFSSGSTAPMTLLQALKPDDHVIAPDDLYFGVRLVLQDIFVPWGLRVSFVDMTDLDLVQKTLQENTRLILIETPSNPMLKVTDISRMAEIAHKAGAILACDNTIPTPVLQRPLELGADFVIHATTKYIAGHSDVLGGALIAKEDGELWQDIKHIRHIGGAVPSPFDCWLTLRGIQTLPVRVRTQAETALKVCQFLAEHHLVERVNYPGLPTHPDHKIAVDQMSQFGGLFSFQIKGGAAEAMAVAAKVNIFTRATSFGGTHSLIEHRASIEGPTSKTPQNLLRVSIGLENAEDLVEDLSQALS
jgi:cystathionine gamma-synthase